MTEEIQDSAADRAEEIIVRLQSTIDKKVDEKDPKFMRSVVACVRDMKTYLGQQGRPVYRNKLEEMFLERGYEAEVVEATRERIAKDNAIMTGGRDSRTFYTMNRTRHM